MIRPALLADAWVVCDRYVDSSLAYQGAARGLGIDAVRELNAVATGGTMPDLTFVLLLDPGLALARRAGRPDRIEREDEAFVRRVDAGYRTLVAATPERYVVLDGALPPEQLAAQVTATVGALVAL